MCTWVEIFQKLTKFWVMRWKFNFCDTLAISWYDFHVSLTCKQIFMRKRVLHLFKHENLICLLTKNGRKRRQINHDAIWISFQVDMNNFHTCATRRWKQTFSRQPPLKFIAKVFSSSATWQRRRQIAKCGRFSRN